ncbi:hypothetical protein NMH_0168 [Neisseria meningitidis H44/76]|uniref:Uncharacterized protein n=3 Tax=Neisseria meningitidis TaxID=487 RepID=A0A0H5DLL9_NEIMI|nr:hypothetical protein NMA510612_0498 [Neisseria meningitidis]EFV64569.1 hypothetical protein NMH_0168 [Neisseria meningitidis H44/76]KER40181.1 hypothetical protein F528_0875 [Neisseria meningitidis 992008]CRL92294.1 hypothetical protein [Neisseria meningitidis serogroup B]
MTVIRQWSRHKAAAEKGFDSARWHRQTPFGISGGYQR